MSAIDIKAMVTAFDALVRDPKRNPINPDGYFESLNCLDQRTELSYYLDKHEDAMQEAINDWMDFKALKRAWRAADTAMVWKLLTDALSKALAQRIDEEHEQGDAE